MTTPKVISCVICSRIFAFVPGITTKCPACGTQYTHLDEVQKGVIDSENDSSKEEN
jgi:hypothetical protein